MIPTKSNIADQGCLPTSSNCVIWQGPDISCLNLCAGDTISDVVYKLALQVCELETSTGLTDLELTCLINVCTATAEPEKTLFNVLQLIINKICCLADIVDGLPPDDTDYVEPILNLPACLQYLNNLGQPVTSLPHSEFTLHLATQFCSLKTIVDSHTTQITNIQDRLTVIENEVETPLPEITPNCILTPGTPTPMDEVLDELENQYCQLRAILGNNNQLAQIPASQCPDLSNQQALSVAGTMSSIPGWNTVVTTVAQSLVNLWLTVCDMRLALEGVQGCCDSDCSDITLDFQVVLINSGAGANVYFSSSSIPLGFTNCTGVDTILTVTDGIGGQWQGQIDLVDAANSLQPVVIDFGGLLNPNMDYTFKLEACLTNGTVQCEKIHIETVDSVVNNCGLVSNLNVVIQ